MMPRIGEKEMGKSIGDGIYVLYKHAHVDLYRYRGLNIPPPQAESSRNVEGSIGQDRMP